MFERFSMVDIFSIVDIFSVMGGTSGYRTGLMPWS
jgi:hypothetical protein